MRSATSGLLMALLLAASGGAGAQAPLYRWTDRQGTVHFTDNYDAVPPRYRKQVGPAPTRPASPPTSKRVVPAPAPPSAAAPPPLVEAAPGPRRIEVHYVSHEGRAQRIIIPVTFNDSVTADVLLDTGAPGTLISPSLAERLGLMRQDQGKLLVRAGGIGGTTTATLVIIDSMAVGPARVEFVPTKVTPTLSSGAFEGLVGMDFMASYTIQIETDRNVLVLTERPPRPDAPAGRDEGWWRGMFEELGQQRTHWRDTLARIDEKLRASDVETGHKLDELRRLRALAEQQVGETEKLFDRLDRYASRHRVPRQWR